MTSTYSGKVIASEAPAEPSSEPYRSWTPFKPAARFVANRAAFGAATVVYVINDAWDSPSPASRPRCDEPLWRTYIQKRFRDFAHGDPAEVPHGDTLWAAWRQVDGLLDATSPTPSVVPGEDGAVEFVWQKGGWYVGVEVGPESAYVWAKHPESGEVLSGDLSHEDVREPTRDLIASLANPRIEG